MAAESRRIQRWEILQRDGNLCHWCGEPMEISEKGKEIFNPENVATLEHHVAKMAGDYSNKALWVLAHHGCNI